MTESPVTPSELFRCLEWATVEQRSRCSLVFLRAVSGVGEVTGVPFAPYNADSFEACESLLERVPGLRERLPLVGALSPLWAEIVESWDFLEGNLRRKRYKRVTDTLAQFGLKCGGMQ